MKSCTALWPNQEQEFLTRLKDILTVCTILPLLSVQNCFWFHSSFFLATAKVCCLNFRQWCSDFEWHAWVHMLASQTETCVSQRKKRKWQPKLHTLSRDKNVNFVCDELIHPQTRKTKLWGKIWLSCELFSKDPFSQRWPSPECLLWQLRSEVKELGWHHNKNRVSERMCSAHCVFTSSDGGECQATQSRSVSRNTEKQKLKKSNSVAEGWTHTRQQVSHKILSSLGSKKHRSIWSWGRLHTLGQSAQFRRG